MPWDSKYSVPWDENDLGKGDGRIEIFLPLQVHGFKWSHVSFLRLEGCPH